MARTPDSDDARFVRRERTRRPTPSREPGRHAARRAAMMLLYRIDLVDGDPGEALETWTEEQGAPMPAYGRELVLAVSRDRDGIDAAVQRHLEGWEVGRLGAVERAVLRIAASELRAGDVPVEVAIDEAVELARRYATPDAARLVNGVLGGMVRGAEAAAGDPGDEPGDEEE